MGLPVRTDGKGVLEGAVIGGDAVREGTLTEQQSRLDAVVREKERSN